MRSNNMNVIGLSAMMCVALLSLGTVQVANAQFEQNPPTKCYRVTALPSDGTVTSSEDPPVAVAENDFFIYPPILIYRAPSVADQYFFSYEVNALEFVPSGEFFCSETTTQQCSGIGDPSCPANEGCLEKINTVCHDDQPELDSATITFNIVDEDACSPDGRASGCGPDNQ